MMEQLREQMAQFVVQRDDLVLLLGCTDPDTALAAKIVESLDESSSSELFWQVVDEFRDPASYASACVQSFAIKHETVQLALEKEQQPPWPAIPPRVINAGGLPPVERLKQLMVFSRSLLPFLEGCGVVWSFLPMTISNAPAYADFMAALWRHDFPFPWCHHIRMIVRDSSPDSLFKIKLAGAPRVKVFGVDFSPDAIRKSLEIEAGDDRTPLGDRVNSALMLAGIDYSHGRYDLAFKQYDLVHRYAAASKNPTLAAIALNGMGEVQRSQGGLDLAGEFFQAGIAPAAQAPGPPVPILFNLYLNLGELRHKQKRWEEAEVFLHGAGEFAYFLHDPVQRLRCWKLVGEAQYQQAKTEAALKTWQNGAIVAGKLHMDMDHKDFVNCLRDHYERKRDENGLRTTLKQVQDGISAQDQKSGAAQSNAEIREGRRDGIPG